MAAISVGILRSGAPHYRVGSSPRELPADRTCKTDDHGGRILRDLLPAPDQLVPKEDAIKVTISLSARSIHFFKTEAAKGGVQYQRMIRRVLDAYVEAFGGPAGAVAGRSSRVEESSPKRRRRTASGR